MRGSAGNSLTLLWLHKGTQGIKARTLPKSVKLAPKAPKPLKIVLREPIKHTPNELILQIKDRAVNGERLTSLIKAFRILTPKSLLVYPTTETVSKELT